MIDDAITPDDFYAGRQEEFMRRRDFLIGLRKWSQAVIGGIVLGGFVATAESEAGWVDSRGSWVNGRVVGSANRGGSWINGGGGGGDRRGGGGWVKSR